MPSFFGFEFSEAAGSSKPDDLLKLLEAMRPSPSPAPLIRIGLDNDGGYLLPDDLEGVGACFSPGVENRKDFEDQLASKYGIISHLCDASSDADRLRTPPIDGLQTFEKLWLDVTGAEDSVSLDDWIARHRPDPRDDLILQMDIEGAEYRNVLGASDDTLRRFRVIIMEVHRLHMARNADVLSNVLLPFFPGWAHSLRACTLIPTTTRHRRTSRTSASRYRITSNSPSSEKTGSGRALSTKSSCRTLTT